MSLEFWNKVEKTNPKYTKEAKVSGQKRTAVDAQYKKKMITEQFGMYGLGWGVLADSEKYERVHFENSTCILNYTATAFYVWKGETARLPIAAQIKESYMTSGGTGYLKVDDEAVKKVRTDALTKAFTELGFCADIHMGMFDDQDYVEGARLAQNIKDSEQKEDEARKKHGEIKVYVDEQIAAIKFLTNPIQVNKAIDRVISKVQVRCQAAGFSSKGFETILNNEKVQENEK